MKESIDLNYFINLGYEDEKHVLDAIETLGGRLMYVLKRIIELGCHKNTRSIIAKELGVSWQVIRDLERKSLFRMSNCSRKYKNCLYSCHFNLLAK
jgi:DNA-directed RNA polymerase sigma subunit (sigma70/sigma32)